MPARKPDTYEIARTRILHEVLSFCITHKWQRDDGTSYTSGGIHGFIDTSFGKRDMLQIGDLVILKSAPATKWTIGWYLGTDRPEGYYEDRYLIQSLEDQTVSGWTNVGISYLDREHLRPEWRWSDRQFEFNKRWLRAAGKATDYDVRPLYCTFDNDAVTLEIRARYAWDNEIPNQSRSFPDWRKVKVADMQAAALEMEAEIERLTEERNARNKAEREAANA